MTDPMRSKTLESILNNEICNVCNKKLTEKCLTCILSNRIAGYCIEHHGMDNFHKAVWISALE